MKGGGPVRSLAALAYHLGDQLDLYIVCQDRDVGDATSYPGVQIGIWTTLEQSQVLYLRTSQFTGRQYRTLLTELTPDVLYLNTLFSFRQMVLPALVARRYRPTVTIVLAPQGCLDPGALSLKTTKKQVFLLLLRMTRLPRMITWQASSDLEARFITDAVGSVRVTVASDMPSEPPGHPFAPPRKEPGTLRIVFLSRISPKKNLTYLLDRLARVRGSVEFTIAGPLEDKGYWVDCQRRIDDADLAHVHVTVTGVVAHDEVREVLSAHHVFALPTRGENFGHAIIEALQTGLGVLISDQTPWRHLAAKGAGWDLPLKDSDAWEAALQSCCDMDEMTFRIMSDSARAVGAEVLDLNAIKRANLALFGGLSA